MPRTAMVKLRPARPVDAAALARFSREAFAAAFGETTSVEDMNIFFGQSRTEGVFHAAIIDPAQRVQLAEVDDQIAAYALLVLGQGFSERPEPRPLRPVYLSQLYCSAEMTGRGLGAALMDWALEEARAWGADAVQLPVWSGNHGAQRFYRRHGFEHVADIDFWVGNQCDHEFLYELKL
jgi:ribosomal protein S18 acetylase RimI-like enzyme